jgi:hypothetical protein
MSLLILTSGRYGNFFPLLSPLHVKLLIEHSENDKACTIAAQSKQNLEAIAEAVSKHNWSNERLGPRITKDAFILPQNTKGEFPSLADGTITRPGMYTIKLKGIKFVSDAWTFSYDIIHKIE